MSNRIEHFKNKIAEGWELTANQHQQIVFTRHTQLEGEKWFAVSATPEEHDVVYTMQVTGQNKLKHKRTSDHAKLQRRHSN
jgi:hypothetical protein